MNRVSDKKQIIAANVAANLAETEGSIGAASGRASARKTKSKALAAAPKSSPPLAKITRPGSEGVFARERLFQLLDDARQHTATWICGPAGAGKTSLVASYIAARRRPGIWYQVDAGDADISTLFHYLGLAAKKLPHARRGPLPHLTPEYLPGLETFARRFFEDLFGRLTLPFVIVLDNYQEVAAESPFHQVVNIALSAVPPGGTMILVSRADPPPVLMRWYASTAMAAIHGNDLRLTTAESTGLAALWGDRDAAELRQIIDITRGWAAAMVLMLRAHDEGMKIPLLGDEPRKPVFDYFAAEVFAKMPQQVRDFLLQTAFLPSVTPQLAAKLTGMAGAGELLGELSRNQFFTTRREHADSLFEYHPLFREFLLARAAEMFPQPELSQLKRTAGLLLEKDGQIEAAAALLRESGEWPELVRLICQNAPALMKQGRGGTLEVWIRAVPPPVFEQIPWLLFWLGTIRLPFDTPESRRHLAAAHALFKAQRDVTGSFLAFSGVVDTYFFDWADTAPMNEWMAELEEFSAHHPDFISPEIEARVIAGLQHLIVREPRHPLLEAWLARAMRLMRASEDANQRVTLANFVVFYHILRGHFPTAGLIIAEIKPLLAVSGIAPIQLIEWNVIEAFYNWHIAAHDAAARAFQKAHEIACSSGVRVLEQLIYAEGVLASLSAGDADTADDLLGKMEATLNPAKRLDVGQYYQLKSGAALLRGDVQNALQYGHADTRIHAEIGPPYHTAVSKLGFTQVLIEQGDVAGARECLMLCAGLVKASNSLYLLYRLKLIEAYLHVLAGERTLAHQPLREALRLGRENNYISHFPWWLPKALSRLFAEALDAGIETDYVKYFIRVRRLLPESAETEEWPWPIKIFTLGHFAVLKDGATAEFSGKARQKPLAMLKALVAMGGRDVGAVAMIEALWPDAEGDAAQISFDSTLYRLRKLLGLDGAVTLYDGKLSLNPQLCWVDVAALQRVQGRLEALAQNGDESADAEIERLAERSMRLYQGHFLSHDEESPWLLTRRDSLRSRFLRNICQVGQRWEHRNQWDKALALYQRGLEEDALAEELYRRLMTCLHQLRRPAEATDAYRRCRNMLSIVLGLAPSAETEMLRQRLLS